MWGDKVIILGCEVMVFFEVRIGFCGLDYGDKVVFGWVIGDLKLGMWL